MFKKNYFLLLYVAVIMLIYGFFMTEETIDVNVHDTYYVVASSHLFWLFALLLCFFFTIYFLFDKGKIKLLRTLTAIHVFGTLLSVLGIFFFPYSIFLPELSLHYYSDANFYVAVSGLLFLFVQILFIINIFVTIIKYILAFVAKR